MNGTSHPIEIACNPANPVNYLACCGLFDLLTRMAPEARGSWRIEAPTAFCLTSSVSEADLLTTVLDAFSIRQRWRAQRPQKGGEPTWYRVKFVGHGRRTFAVALDCWLETAELDGSIASNSAWKMFAGQQTIEAILIGKEKGRPGMIDECAAYRSEGTSPSNLSELLKVERRMTGRLGFDPRSCRTSLDRGWSANDLNIAIPTALFAEMLALFGANSFFPARSGRPKDRESTRGWQSGAWNEEDHFDYALWQRPLPITLARRAALPSPASVCLRSMRATRKDYSNLSFAQPN